MWILKTIDLSLNYFLYRTHVIIGIRKSSAQITSHYTKEELVDRQIVAVVNFPKKQIGKFMSECLVLGAVGEQGDVVLLSPDFKIENGLRIA